MENYEATLKQLNQQINDCSLLLDNLETYNFDFEGSPNISLACRELSTQYFALVNQREQLYQENFSRFPKTNTLIKIQQKIVKNEREIVAIRAIIHQLHNFTENYEKTQTLTTTYSEFIDLLEEAIKTRDNLNTLFQKTKEKIERNEDAE